MKKIAILIDLELTKTSGGHVKFWERICNAIKNEKLDFISVIMIHLYGESKIELIINRFDLNKRKAKFL